MDALTTCNACDAAPMALGQLEPGQPGYCGDCLTAPTIPQAVIDALAAWDRLERWPRESGVSWDRDHLPVFFHTAMDGLRDAVRIQRS